MTETAARVTLADLIDQLAPMTDPGPVSMVPQTAGWAVLGALLTGMLIWTSLRALRTYRANAYRREALHRLEHAKSDPKAIALLLRQTALAAYPRRRVASLSGSEWLNFLDETSDVNEFSKGHGQILAQAPYQRFSAPSPETAALARFWIRKHRSSKC